MTPFSRNVVANLLATGWTYLVQLAVVPVLIALVGVASYALIGFYASLIAALAILDLGLSTSLMRRMAGVRVAGADRERAADSFRTYERVFWIAGLVLGACVALAAPVIATRWLSSDSLSAAEVERSVRLIGLLIGLRWPVAPYLATLYGLQKQVGINALNAAAVTLASVGGLALLAWVERTIEVYLVWQCVCAAAQIAVLRTLALKALPEGARGRFAAATLLDQWRFSSGLTALTLTGVILMQGDKLLLAKLVPLEEFGYYALAFAVSGALYTIITPVFNAALPRLCEHVAARDETALRRSFEDSASLMAALVLPVGAFLILFAHDLLLLWTRAPLIAERSAPLLAILAAGTSMNALTNVPYALQIARANTSIGLAINSALCVLLVPAMLVLTYHFGVVGGATTALLMNGLYLLVGLPLTYHLCLGSRGWPAYYGGVLRRQGPALALLAAVRWALPAGNGSAWEIVPLAAALLAAGALSVAFTPPARELLPRLGGQPARPAR